MIKIINNETKESSIATMVYIDDAKIIPIEFQQNKKYLVCDIIDNESNEKITAELDYRY